MSQDRFITFAATNKPNVDQLQAILEDLIGDCGKVTKKRGRLLSHLPGRRSFPFKRIVDPRVHPLHDGELGRGFEVDITALGDAEPCVDVITRQGDEFTCALAERYAEIVARFFQGKVTR